MMAWRVYYGGNLDKKKLDQPESFDYKYFQNIKWYFISVYFNALNCGTIYFQRKNNILLLSFQCFIHFQQLTNWLFINFSAPNIRTIIVIFLETLKSLLIHVKVTVITHFCSFISKPGMLESYFIKFWILPYC